MKKLILLLNCITFVAVQFINAQPSTDTLAPYLKQKEIPEFAVLLYDSSFIINKSTLVNKPLLCLTYFSPSCEHCQQHAQLIAEKLDSIPNIFYLWIGPSYSTLNEIKEFAVKYKLTNKPNLYLGKEINYFLPPYFRMETTPYCVVFKKNELFVEFRNGASINDYIAISNNTFDPKILMQMPQLKPQEEQSPKKEKKKVKKPE